MAAMNELPTLQEELDRKTVETLQWIVSMSISGQMSSAELKVAIQTVFGIVAGLVANDTMDILKIAEADAKAKTTVRRVFTSSESPKLFVVSWEVGADRFYVTGQSLLGDKTIKEQKYEFASAEAANDKCNALCNQLTTAYGLTELK